MRGKVLAAEWGEEGTHDYIVVYNSLAAHENRLVKLYLTVDGRIFTVVFIIEKRHYG